MEKSTEQQYRVGSTDKYTPRTIEILQNEEAGFWIIEPLKWELREQMSSGSRGKRSEIYEMGGHEVPPIYEYILSTFSPWIEVFGTVKSVKSRTSALYIYVILSTARVLYSMYCARDADRKFRCLAVAWYANREYLNTRYVAIGWPTVGVWVGNGTCLPMMTQYPFRIRQINDHPNYM